MVYPTEQLPLYSAYPGGYVDLPKNEEIIIGQIFSREVEIIHPPVLITETKDLIKIEVAVPGAKREEIMIDANKNLLNISIENNQLGGSKKKIYKIEIPIPENVD